MPEELQPTQVQEPEKDPETGKFIYTYQPRDSEGQFIGKPYKYLYTDHQDLVRQLTEGKEMGDRWILEVKSGKRTVQGDPAQPRPSFEPAPESAEETEKKSREAFRATAEKEFGAPLDSVRESLKKAQALDEYLIAQTWAMNNPDYYACRENAAAIGKYLKEKNYGLTPKNLDLAYEELKDTLVLRPQEQVPADSTQQPLTPTKVEATKTRSTGIIPGQFAGTRQPNAREEKPPLTRERFREINRMSREEWKRLERTNRKEAEAFNSMKYGPAQPQQ